MLGNWAFNGHLSRKAACQQALTLLTDIYGLPKNRLFVTYFGGDEKLGLSADLDCQEVWRELGFSNDRILALDAHENFWEIGASGGPCGPCTEILYSNADPPSVAGAMEIWNIVFISYKKLSDGRLSPLSAMHVDTGMGLERLCSILQGVKTTYETDLFQPLMKLIQDQVGTDRYAGLFGDQDKGGIDTSYRILADHTRMFTVALSDGVAPASTKAGHILRRVLRNAAYQASLMSSNAARKRRGKVNLADLCTAVANTLGDAYPELHSNLDYVREVVEQEQSIFDDLLRRGKRRLGVLLTAKNDRAETTDFLELQRKYALPIEEMRSMTKRKNITFNEEELLQRLEEHAKATPPFLNAGAFEPDAVNIVSELKAKQVPLTDDSWKYRTLKVASGRYSVSACQSKIVAIAEAGRLVDKASSDSCTIILDRTPFYAEAGGQAGDRGVIKYGSSLFQVSDTIACGAYIFHLGRLISGDLTCGDIVEAVVDEKWRTGCMQHHTATHLVMSALARLFGNVCQRSSKLNSERSELGFWTSAALTADSVSKLERDANELIQRDATVYTEETDFEKTKTVPCIRRLNGEQYPDVVRVVAVGLPVTQLLESADQIPSSLISAELCCGTHLSSTADIGRLRVTGFRKGSTGLVKAVDFAVGASAVAAEERGDEMRRRVLENLEKIRNQGVDSRDDLRELENHLLEAVIPFSVRSDLLQMVKELSEQNSKRSLKKAKVGGV